MSFKTGDIVKGEVIDFSHEGNGVIKIENFTIFASDGLIGDIVKVKIEKLKKNYAIASLVEIIQTSKDRVELCFDLHESKGGIPLIEYSYENQLEWKKDKIKRDFEKVVGIYDLNIMDTIGMDNPYRYRNHVQIPLGEKNGKTVIGFYEAASNEIVDMDASILQPEIGDRVLKLIRIWIARYDIKAYDKRTRKGLLRHIGMRFNRDNQVMIILVTANNNLPRIKELIYLLRHEKVISIFQNLNNLNSSITYGRQYKKLYGDDSLIDYISEYKFNISPNSFFQVNRVQTEVLYNKAIEYLDLSNEDIVYDLYCGIGTISIFVANKAKKVYGIEVVKAAIENAKENAKINDIDNVEFILGRTEEAFPKMNKEGIIANKIVLDPPRKGCEKETLEAIVELNPERVVYVSCNPSTLARDVKYLVENGYRVVEVQPVDMFPHSAHVETCVLLSHKKSQASSPSL